MNSNEKREEIVTLINNIKEHSDRLSNMPHMPLLEVSAILSKINRLHESTVVLKYLLAKEQHHEDREFGLRLPHFDLDDEEEEVEEEKTTSLTNDLEEDLDSIDEIDDEQDQEENEEEDEEEDFEMDTFNINPSQNSTSDHEETSSVKYPTDVEIEEIERKSGLSSKSDLNEQYAEEQEDRSLSEQLKKQPITDLLAAIGLNERYLYANDLFGGDIEEFRKVIRLLNEFDNEIEATRYFNGELRRTYGWDDDHELAEALFLLVKRRFQNNG